VPLLSVALFLAMAAYQAGKPLHLDNAEFAPAAEAVADTGVPIYYRGEEIGRTIEGENVRRQRRWSGAELDESQLSALYHPPLYVHALAGWFLLFGKGAFQARMLNAVGAVLMCWLVVRLSRRLLGPRSRAVDWAVWPTVLLQAYTLQASGILDIDTSIYGPLLLAVAVAAVAAGRRQGARLECGELLLLGALVAVAMWAKLTTVWLLVAVIPLLLWPRLPFVRAVLAAAGAAAVGIVLFQSTFLTYCMVMDLDPRDTFHFLLASFQRGGAVPPYAANFAATAPHVARWTGLLPWAAAALALTPWFARGLSLERASRIQLRALVAVALLGCLYYMAQTRTFGNAPFKYILVFWPLVLLPSAILTGAAAARALTSARTAAVGLSVAAGALGAGLLVAARVTRDEHLHLMGTTSGVALGMLALPAVVGLAAAARWAFRGSGVLAPLLWLAAAALQTGFQAGVAVVQVRAPYSTDYDYGQMGLSEAIAYVRAHTGEHEVISSMKDIAYQARRPYIETYQPLYVSEERAKELIRSWEDGRVSLIVFTEGIGQDQAWVRPILAEWLARNAELVASPGHYRIYRPVRRGAGGGTAP
jgi:hypothetical protein